MSHPFFHLCHSILSHSPALTYSEGPECFIHCVSVGIFYFTGIIVLNLAFAKQRRWLLQHISNTLTTLAHPLIRFSRSILS